MRHRRRDDRCEKMVTIPEAKLVELLEATHGARFPDTNGSGRLVRSIRSIQPHLGGSAMRARDAKVGGHIKHKPDGAYLGTITRVYSWGVRFDRPSGEPGLGAWGEVDRDDPPPAAA